MSGNTIPSSSIVLAWFWPFAFGPATAWPVASLPSSSMISQGLAGSFQPSRAFNDFQKHGDRSHGSHDEASQPISGGKEAEHSPSAGPQRALCFPPSPLPAPGTESPWSGGCAKQKFCPESCSQPIRIPSFLPHNSPHERMLQ